MEEWTLHWLEAAGSLSGWRSEILSEFQIAYEALSAFLPPPRLDVLIQKARVATIPETGTGGRACSETLLEIFVDPDNPSFAHSLRTGEFGRGVIHEVHHCMRMAGPGYGWTLGEALVSEGLAGQFVRKLFGNDPEPWEKAFTQEQLYSGSVDFVALTTDDYDHSEWFFGSGSKPRWLGYSLGYEMVGSWLKTTREIDANQWINVPAATIIEVAVKEGLISGARY